MRINYLLYSLIYSIIWIDLQILLYVNNGIGMFSFLVAFVMPLILYIQVSYFLEESNKIIDSVFELMHKVIEVDRKLRIEIQQLTEQR